MAQTGVGAKPVFAPTLFSCEKMSSREGLLLLFSQKVTPRCGYSGG